MPPRQGRGKISRNKASKYSSGCRRVNIMDSPTYYVYLGKYGMASNGPANEGRYKARRARQGWVLFGLLRQAVSHREPRLPRAARCCVVERGVGVPKPPVGRKARQLQLASGRHGAPIPTWTSRCELVWGYLCLCCSFPTTFSKRTRCRQPLGPNKSLTTMRWQ